MTQQLHDARVLIVAGLRPVLNELLELLSATQPDVRLATGGALLRALDEWSAAVSRQTAQPEREQLHALEHGKLELMGKLAVAQKDTTDLRAHNQQLREDLIRANQKIDAARKEQMEAKLAVETVRANAKALDLEVRDLRRRVRELEGGPPLTPAEAAPEQVRALLAPEAQAVAASPAVPAPQVVIPWPPLALSGVQPAAEPSSAPPSLAAAPPAEVATRSSESPVKARARPGSKRPPAKPPQPARTPNEKSVKSANAARPAKKKAPAKQAKVSRTAAKKAPAKPAKASRTAAKKGSRTAAKKAPRRRS
ncbi:MAG: hypothetical protein IT371_26840 [Deltaproteobacteria bacterium]|nr:hypothetical protein [Deltaproteobacteria bacterium]